MLRANELNMTETTSAETQSISNAINIASNHPSLAGHFPQNPIVPGVVILDQVIRLWQKNNHYHIAKIQNAKFINILHAETPCSVRYTKKSQGKIEFLVEQHKTNIVICKGIFL